MRWTSWPPSFILDRCDSSAMDPSRCGPFESAVAFFRFRIVILPSVATRFDPSQERQLAFTTVSDASAVLRSFRVSMARVPHHAAAIRGDAFQHGSLCAVRRLRMARFQFGMQSLRCSRDDDRVTAERFRSFFVENPYVCRFSSHVNFATHLQATSDP